MTKQPHVSRRGCKMTTDIGPKPPRPGPRYLGDAVYASFDGWQIHLRTGDGNRQSIFLEPSVVEAFIQYAKDVGVTK